MENPAPANYTLHELIERRWSPRAFSDEQLEETTLLRIFEAARWAPSSYNAQPWSFLVGRNVETGKVYDRLLDCLVETNQSWAQSAPVLGLSVARKEFEHNGRPNPHHRHDLGLAMENLVLQALDEDVFVHQMAGFNRKKARETFSIPESHEPVTAFAMGHADNPENLPEELAEREKSERTRKPLDQQIFSDEWKEPAPFLDQVE